MVLAYTGANSDGVFDTEEHQFDDFYASFDWDVNARHDLRTSILHFRERSDGYDESNLSPRTSPSIRAASAGSVRGARTTTSP